MCAKFTLGFILCLASVGQVQASPIFDKAADFFRSLWDSLTVTLWDPLSDLFQSTKRLGNCLDVTAKCKIDSDLEVEDPCGAARKIGLCVFTSCPELYGSGEENVVIELLNKLFSKVPDCDLKAEALAAEVNAGVRGVSLPFSLLIGLVLTTALVKQMRV